MSKHKRVNIKAILSDPIIREEIVEGATDFICKVEGIRSHLSPAARAVLDAYADVVTSKIMAGRYVEEAIAAALRVAADQFFYDWNGMCCADHLKYIAAELEGGNG